MEASKTNYKTRIELPYNLRKSIKSNLYTNVPSEIIKIIYREIEVNANLKKELKDIANEKNIQYEEAFKLFRGYLKLTYSATGSHIICLNYDNDEQIEISEEQLHKIEKMITGYELETLDYVSIYNMYLNTERFSGKKE